MTWELRQGHVLDRLREMPDESVHCCVTSPPYWGLRDYEVDGQLGLEETPEQFVAAMVEVFAEVKRVLRADGSLWLNIGDGYATKPPGQTAGGMSGSSTLHGSESARYKATKDAGSGTKRNTIAGESIKPKDLIGVPWMLAFALRADGWYLRRDVIWAKPSCMPEAVTDRPTTSHEYLFLLTKSPRYFYDSTAIREPAVSAKQTAHNERYAREYEAHTERAERGEGTQPGNNGNQGIHSRPGPGGRNKRSVWTIATEPFPESHFATFPTKLVEPCIKAGTSPKVCGECGTPWRRGDGPRRMDMSRPQARRAIALVAEHGLTDAHIEAIRACGVTDAGKAQHTQSGFGNNDADVQVLADEAKAALGGYYREFLLARPSGGALESSCDHADDTGRAIVLDPFAGAATTLLVATQLGRDSIGIELNPEYVELGEQRIRRWEADPAGHLRRQEPVEAQTSLLDMEQTLA